MSKRRVYTLLFALLGCIVLVITGHMDLDWQINVYYWNSIQNSWSYWEYCPDLRIDWWTAYLIQVLRIAVGWFGIGWVLNEVKTCLVRQ